MFKADKNLKILILGTCISSVGDWLNILALMTLVISFSSSGSVLSILMIVRALPKIVLGPVIAGIIDRLDKKKILIAANVVSGIIVLFLPLSQNLLEIYIISFLLSTINIFVLPTISSIVPLIVEKDSLVAANSLFSSANSIINIAAPIISGVVLSLFNLSTGFYIDSFTFFIFSMLVILLKFSSSSKSADEQYRFTRILSNSKAGFSFILKNDKLKRVLQGIFLANFTMGTIYVAEVIFFKNELNIMPNVYGQFLAAVGVGFLISSMIMNKLSRKYKLYSIFSIGIVILGIGVALFAMNTSLYLVVILLIVEGFGESLFTISGTTIIQQNTDESNRSSILTFNDSLSKSAFLVSMGAAGVMSDMIGSKYTLLAAGIISALYIIVFLKNNGLDYYLEQKTY